MSEKFLKKFRKISEGAVKSNVKHLVLVVTDDKKVHIEGSNNLLLWMKIEMSLSDTMSLIAYHSLHRHPCGKGRL